MLLALRTLDLAIFASMGALWLALGAFVFTLYAWLVRRGGAHHDGAAPYLHSPDRSAGSHPSTAS